MNDTTKYAIELTIGTEFFGATDWRRVIGTKTLTNGKVEVLAVLWNEPPRRGLPATFLFEPSELLRVRG